MLILSCSIFSYNSDISPSWGTLEIIIFVRPTRGHNRRYLGLIPFLKSMCGQWVTHKSARDTEVHVHTTDTEVHVHTTGTEVHVHTYPKRALWGFECPQRWAQYVRRSVNIYHKSSLRFISSINVYIHTWNMCLHETSAAYVYLIA